MSLWKEAPDAQETQPTTATPQEPDGAGRPESEGERAVLRVTKDLSEGGDIFTAQIALNEEEIALL